MAIQPIEALIHTANYIHKYGQPVPVDVLARLLELGVDIKKYT
jgi:hypothetical protein